MELESESGSKITLQKGAKIEIGRGLGLDSNDPTLSRRQISLSLSPNPKSTVQFEVIGKNPIWVYHRDRDEIRVFKRSEMGEMVDGDRVCLSGKNPVWFSVRQMKGREIGCVGDLEFELDSIDVSDLDPVKEFCFLVIGHEFDHYPKHKIRPLKAWDWFLEEYKKESDDDDDEISGRKRSKSTRRKRKKGDVNDDDDEWTGERKEDKELISKSRKIQRPKYSTRSKDRDKPGRDKGRNRSPAPKKIICRDEEDEEDEEGEDETLGGFIVTDNEVKEQDDDDETELDEEEEEDFDEDDDEED